MGFERLVFVSGQGATDPATGQLVGTDVEAQTEQCLRNVETILIAAGSSLQHVLRCGVFLIDMSDLTGIYQSLSFIGLGIVLLGVGWLYQRLLFPASGRPVTSGAAAGGDDRE